MKLRPLLILLLTFSFVLPSTAKKNNKIAEPGDKIAVRYTGRLKDGRVFDHNIGKKKLEFVLGDGTMIKAFDSAFVGMKEGETKSFPVAAEDGYGEFEISKLFRIPREQLPKSASEGDTLKYRVGGGYYPVRIIQIEEKEVYIDANHKLAGKDLLFEVKLLSLEKKQD